MLVREKDNRINMLLILISLMLFTFQLLPDVVAADDHKRRESYDKRYEIRNGRFDHDNHNTRRVKKDDEGNETTGQTAAWLLVAANLTIAFSILMNQFQKKHLMRFHYVLNPVALCIAFFHFLLSSCRSSPLPEWGLILLTVMVFLGLIVKFKLSPKGMRKSVYRLHTGLATFSIMIIFLVVGHLIVD